MKKEHSSRWRKLDNAAQAFPAATGKKDTRVFRFYCQLKEDIQADLLQKALEQTMEHYPVFSMVLRKGLFWFYLEQRDLPAKVEEEKRPPCSEIYVPDHKTLLFQVSYYKTRINFEVFHALTDGTGAMLFLKELSDPVPSRGNIFQGQRRYADGNGLRGGQLFPVLHRKEK